MAKANQKWLEGEVKRLLEEWQPRLLLHVYDIHPKVEYKPEGEYAAHINWQYPYKWAMLMVNSWAPDKTNFTPDHVEKVIVHELTHLLLMPLDNVMEAEFNVTQNDRGYIADRFHGATEETVEHITKVFLDLKGVNDST